MQKLGGLLVVGALWALTGCSSPQPVTSRPPQVVPVVEVADDARPGLLAALRPALTTLDESDESLFALAEDACASLASMSKDEYRESVRAKHPDIDEAMDYLTIAAAAKQYLCP